MSGVYALFDMLISIIVGATDVKIGLFIVSTGYWFIVVFEFHLIDPSMS